MFSDRPSRKVLFVSASGSVYGSERSMLALLGYRNFEAEVVCPNGGDLERELSVLGIKSHPLEFGKYSLRRNPLWHVGFVHRFRRILLFSKPDVVVINLDGNTPLVTLASVLAGVPIVRFSRFEFVPPSRFVDRWCWLKAKAVICPSELVAQQVKRWANPDYLDRVYCFYESYVRNKRTGDESCSVRCDFDMGNDKVIGYVGRLHRGKRIETAIEMLAIVRRNVENARLLIVGGDDGSADSKAYREELRQLANRLSVGNAVTFVGYLDHGRVKAAVSIMDVFVLPSESESFGMVLVEAWAQGVPTVASDVSGCSEITRASDAGFLAPVGDADLFAQKVVRLLTDSQTANDMGQRGKTWVSQNCDPAKYAERFDSILNKLVSET